MQDYEVSKTSQFEQRVTRSSRRLDTSVGYCLDRGDEQGEEAEDARRTTQNAYQNIMKGGDRQAFGGDITYPAPPTITQSGDCATSDRQHDSLSRTAQDVAEHT